MNTFPTSPFLLNMTGALALLDEALEREDVFVSVISTEVSGDVDVMATAAVRDR